MREKIRGSLTLGRVGQWDEGPQKWAEWCELWDGRGVLLNIGQWINH